MAKRKKGSGSIRLRKDGRWEGRYVIGYDDKGLPKTKNVLAKTQGACAEKLKALKKSLAKPQPVNYKPDMLFGDWLDFWYQTYKKSQLRPNTQMSYEQRLYNHMIPALGQIPLSKLTQNRIQQFYISLKQSGRLKETALYGNGLADQTVRGCHITCHAALDAAVSEKLLTRNPANGCKLPSAKSREMQVLTGDEIVRLLIQAKEDGCYELLLLELSTGLRRGEILALQWRDLSFRTGELRVERQVHRVRGTLVISPPKTASSKRIVMLPVPPLSILREHRKGNTSRWIFPSPAKADSPLDPATVRKRLHTILERADCKTVRFHDLRHTFATLSLQNGMDVKTLSTIIGHVSTATTLNIYAHVTDDMRRKAAAKIDAGIAKAEPQTANLPSAQKAAAPPFQPHKGQRRKAGTGCVSQINDTLWEGRYSPIWPDGKKRACNVYAHNQEECERLLAEKIRATKAQIAIEKERLGAAQQAV